MKRILFSIAAMAILTSSPAIGQGWGQSFSPDQARDAVNKGDIVPLRDVFRMLKQRFGGYQLGAELFSKPGGGSEYHIDWMTRDGRKMQFIVDAQSGRITSSSGG